MKDSRYTNMLLAAGTMLLAVNLLAESPPRAHAQVSAGPVDPAPVSIAAVYLSNDTQRVFRLWSDGSVDATKVSFTLDDGCTVTAVCPASTVFPGTCIGDTDRDGSTDFTDLLTVLSTWGPCP